MRPPSGRFLTTIGDVMVTAAGTADFVNSTLQPSIGRVRDLVGHHDFDPGLVPRASMVRAIDGAPLSPLRTFSGRLAHENGLVPSKKSGRMLGWQGENQFNMIVRAQTMHSVATVESESIGFEYVDGGVVRTYTSDISFVAPDGTRRIIEMKRDERDLSDPDLCRTFAIVAELCRCCAISFEILFARDVYASRIHRTQSAEFASRAFFPYNDEQRRALMHHASETGGDTSYGRLSRVLGPTDRRVGVAALQAMTVARVVEIDLTAPLKESTPVRLHPENLGLDRDRRPSDVNAASQPALRRSSRRSGASSNARSSPVAP